MGKGGGRATGGLGMRRRRIRAAGQEDKQLQQDAQAKQATRAPRSFAS
jgi:hypothetical protein